MIVTQWSSLSMVIHFSDQQLKVIRSVKYHFMINIISSLQATDRAILQVKMELQAHWSSLFPLYGDTQRFALVLYEVYVCRAFCCSLCPYQEILVCLKIPRIALILKLSLKC